MSSSCVPEDCLRGFIVYVPSMSSFMIDLKFISKILKIVYGDLHHLPVSIFTQSHKKQFRNVKFPSIIVSQFQISKLHICKRSLFPMSIFQIMNVIFKLLNANFQFSQFSKFQKSWVHRPSNIFEMPDSQVGK